MATPSTPTGGRGRAPPEASRPATEPIDPAVTYRRLQKVKHGRTHPLITLLVVLVVLACGGALAYFVTTARGPAPVQTAANGAPAAGQPVNPGASTPSQPTSQ